MRPNVVMSRGPMRLEGVPAFVLTLALSISTTALAQTQTPPPPPTTPPASQTPPDQAQTPPAQAATASTAQGDPAAPTTKLNVDLDRIKNELDKPPALNLSDQQLRFYVRVYGKAPTFEDIVGSFDLKNGPVPGAGMTYKEFVNMVTPKELYSTAGITPLELLQGALVNWAGQAIIKKGYEEIRNARNAHEIQVIRDRITKELAALAGGGDR
jgi:hypothetical protein